MQGLELTGFFQLPPGARKYYQIFADTMLTQVRRTLEISLTQAYVQKEKSGVKMNFLIDRYLCIRIIRMYPWPYNNIREMLLNRNEL